MTQAEVAMATGVSQPTYQNYEAGTITIPPANLKRLAKALKMTKEEILGRPKVVALPPLEHRPRVDRDDYDDPNGFDESGHYGEIAIHFKKGNPIVLSISPWEHRRLYLELQGDSKFFPIYTLSNQIVGVRRAAVTDVSFASEDSCSFGFEHDLYREFESEIVPGVWSSDADYWDIVEVVACPSEREREDIVEIYGEDRVSEVERDIGLLMPDEIDQMVASGNVLPEERQVKLDQAVATLAKARELGADVKWQLSNGKVRQETVNYDEDLENFWWIARSAQDDDDIIFRGADNQSYWINPDALDYISIPAHKFNVENKKSNERDMATEAVMKKKRRGG